jgi:hypothetical protein
LWKCPKCGDLFYATLGIGVPSCTNDGTLMQEYSEGESVTQSVPVSVGGKVTVGGSVNNSGKIKVFENGELTINKDLINTGDIVINDPEKIKSLLIETLKTSGNLAELGSNILKTFFGK